MRVDSKAPCPLDKGGDLSLLWFPGEGKPIVLPSSIWTGVSSIPSDSRACSSPLKSTNSPEVAMVANLAGMVGMERLFRAIRGRGG